MRIAMIIFAILSLVFIGAISWSLMSQEKWEIKLPTISSEKTEEVDTITLETWKNQVKTDEKLERLTSLVEELAKKNGTYTPESIIPAFTGTEIKSEEPVVGPSGKLLALLMPTVTPELDKNMGIYGLYIFDTNVSYSTYRDASIPLSFMAINTSYETFLKNMKALGGKPYTINEVKTFPFRAFFVNTDTSDTMVRLVIEMEGQTIAFETPKVRYELVKNLLLGKGGTSIKALQNVSNTTKTGTTTVPIVSPKIVAPKIVAPKESTTNSGTTPISTQKSITGTISPPKTRTGTTIRIIQ